MHLRVLSLPVLSLACACGADPKPAPSHPQPQAETPVAPPFPQTAKATFENPGGMWLPEQLAVPKHKDTLKEMGFRFDTGALSDPKSPLLSSVVWLGGCSASFVSSEGLLVTNHHCATGALQHNSSPEKNLLKDGFLARARGDERSNGPSARAFVTQAMVDVTKQVRDGLEAIADDHARYRALEKRQKELTKACEKDRPGIRCTVLPFFEGERYLRIEQLEFRDVRLVYAPSAGIGNYGGEVDNWRWPRHTGDVAFFRVYAGKDGKPADYHTDNIPYHPPHWLPLADKPLASGDPVLVAGYPGRTFQLKTREEVEDAVTFSYPRRQKLCEEYIAELERVSKEGKDIGIVATPQIRYLHNGLTNIRGQLEGLVRGGVLEQKKRDAEALLAYAKEKDPGAKAALEKIAQAVLEAEATREAHASLREVTMLTKLLPAAVTIVRMAEERPKPDEERHPDYQERNWGKLEGQSKALSKTYHPKVDGALVSLAMRRVSQKPPQDRNALLRAVVGGDSYKDDVIAKKVTDLFQKTKLGDEKTRLELLRTATTKKLKGMNDPVMKVALRLAELVHAMEESDERLLGKMSLLRPAYIKALRESSTSELASDANGTLRITYGTVRGYKPKPDAPTFRPFTVLSEVVQKHTGQDPFNAPNALLSAVKEKRVGNYSDNALGDVPVDFLSDLHITGGNSGSATLNADGKLVGLAFDGNYEAMASDWKFQKEIARTIHVDLRYVLWVMDAVDRAHHLLLEMGHKPQFAGP